VPVTITTDVASNLPPQLGAPIHVLFHGPAGTGRVLPIFIWRGGRGRRLSLTGLSITGGGLVRLAPPPHKPLARSAYFRNPADSHECRFPGSRRSPSAINSGLSIPLPSGGLSEVAVGTLFRQPSKSRGAVRLPTPGSARAARGLWLSITPAEL